MENVKDGGKEFAGALNALGRNLFFWGLAIVAVLVSFGFSSRISELFRPFDKKGFSISGASYAGSNRVDMGPQLSLFLDHRPLDSVEDSDYFIGYEIFIRRMGRLEITAVFDDHETTQIAVLVPGALWAFSDSILRGRPLQVVVGTSKDGKATVSIDGQIYASADLGGPHPFNIAMTFLDGEISILKATPLLFGELPLDRRSLKKLHPELQPAAPNAPLVAGFGVCLVILLAFFLSLDHLRHGKDYVSPAVLLVGVLLVLNSRHVNPALLFFALFVSLFLKTLFLLINAKPKWFFFVLAVLPFVGAAAVFFALFRIPLFTIGFVLASAALLALQYILQTRHERRFAEFIAPFMLILALAGLEAGLRIVFPGGRILRGVSEDQFWAMLPLSMPAASAENDPKEIAVRGKLLRKRTERQKPVVFLLGSSVIHGSEIDPSKDPAALLQESLGDSADVFNNGGVGATSFEVVKDFQTIAKAFTPEIVVLYLGYNDIFQSDAITLKEAAQEQKLRMKARGIFSRSTLYRYIAEKISLLKTRTKKDHLHEEAVVRAFQTNMARLVETTKSYGGILILAPEQFQASEKYQQVSRRLEIVMREFEQSPSVMFTKFPIPVQNAVGFPNYTDDVHLTSSGYKYLAQGLLPAVRKALAQLPNEK